MNWTAERIDRKQWRRIPGNPFEDYDPNEGIALWSLWEMPSCAVGKVVRRGRPRGKPTAVRSVPLPVETWKRLEAEAKAEKTTTNALIHSVRGAPQWIRITDLRLQRARSLASLAR